MAVAAVAAAATVVRVKPYTFSMKKGDDQCMRFFGKSPGKKYMHGLSKM